MSGKQIKSSPFCQFSVAEILVEQMKHNLTISSLQTTLVSQLNCQGDTGLKYVVPAFWKRINRNILFPYTWISSLMLQHKYTQLFRLVLWQKINKSKVPTLLRNKQILADQQTVGWTKRTYRSCVWRRMHVLRQLKIEVDFHRRTLVIFCIAINILYMRSLSWRVRNIVSLPLYWNMHKEYLTWDENLRLFKLS